MSEIAIRVEGLGKEYRIGGPEASYRTIRESLSGAMLAPLRRAAKLLSGQPYGAAGMNGTIWALRDISFQVEQGEVMGVIGRNGAGKTTLLKVLSRITEPTAGRAEIHGRVGSLLEVGTGFHPELTGRENIYLSGAILGMKRAEIDHKFDQIVEFSGVEKFIDTPFKHYSSGMVVRLGFSVAAHMEPEILLVDEVLAVGDAAFQKKCLGKMGEVARGGRTVLFVSHNMAAIQGLCSRCCLLDRGRLITEGAPEEVVAQYLVSLSQSTAIPLGERKDREGSGAVRFTEISILDGKGHPIEQALSGQDIAIALSYRSEADRPVRELQANVTFYTMHGQFMFNCSSQSSGQPFEFLPPSGRLICHIPELPLAPGRYIFNLYSRVNGAVADGVEQAGDLDVAAGDYFGTGQLETHKHGLLVRNHWTYEG